MDDLQRLFSIPAKNYRLRWLAVEAISQFLDGAHVALVNFHKQFLRKFIESFEPCDSAAL